MSLANTLRQQLMEKGHDKHAVVRSVVLSGTALIESIVEKRDEIQKDRNYTKEGQTSAFRKFAEFCAANVGQKRRAVEKGRAELSGSAVANRFGPRNCVTSRHWWRCRDLF